MGVLSGKVIVRVEMIVPKGTDPATLEGMDEAIREAARPVLKHGKASVSTQPVPNTEFEQATFTILPTRVDGSTGRQLGPTQDPPATEPPSLIVTPGGNPGGDGAA